jgi:hypothetical protein
MWTPEMEKNIGNEKKRVYEKIPLPSDHHHHACAHDPRIRRRATRFRPGPSGNGWPAEPLPHACYASTDQVDNLPITRSGNRSAAALKLPYSAR